MNTALLTRAIRTAMAATAMAAVALPASTAFAQNMDQEAEVEEVVVTGSRIKRSTNTESQTVITISADDIAKQGDFNPADVLRSSTLNSFGSMRESSGSSAQSNATVDLRGVGASRTLVMVDGRRVVGSASLGGGGTVNLNMIPSVAIESIDMIADGASATYGSDAIAGVVNINMLKNFDGLKFNARYGDRSQDDGNEESISLVTGTSSDRGSITFAVEYQSRDEIYDRDRWYTAPSKSDQDGDGDITGYNETTGISYYGYTLKNPNWTKDTVYDKNNPDTWYVTPGKDCVDDGAFVGPLKADAVFGKDTGYYCGYAYAGVSANRASTERTNVYVNSSFELADNVELYSSALVSQLESFGRYAPPAAPGAALASDPKNPYGQDVDGYFRWVDIGTRDNVVNDTMTDINIGLRGDINDSVSYDVYYSFSEYRSTSVGMYYLSYSGFDYNIHNEVTEYDTYVDNLKATTLNDDRQKLEKVFAGVQWDLFDMAGGKASTYWSAEHFTQNYAALVDAQSEAGLIGGSAGNSAEGSRDVTALSVEAIFPVTDWLEIDAAFRYDDYSDFGTATSPRIGVIATPLENLVLKASWGEGFRAPDLSELYGATSYSAEEATDYYGCQLQDISYDDCTSRQFDTYIGSNDQLGAEESTTYSVGAEYTFLENWTVGINYFNLQLENAINYVSAQDMLDVDYFNGGNNPKVTRNELGSPSRIDAGYVNSTADLAYDSIDMTLRGFIDSSVGQFGVNWSASYYLTYETIADYGTGEIDDVAGDLGLPDLRSNVTFSYSVANFYANWTVDYIGSQDSKGGSDSWGSYATNNINVAYDLNEFGMVKLGANNAFDRDPLIYQGGEADDNLYDNIGRVLFLEYSYEM